MTLCKRIYTWALYSFLFKSLTTLHHFHFRNIGEKEVIESIVNSKIIIEALGCSLFLDLHSEYVSQCLQIS